MAQALRGLGVDVQDDGEAWRVTGGLDRLSTRSDRVDVGNAGTVARFVPPVAALARGTATVDGDPRIRERPLGPLINALRVLGADVDDGGRGALPITVRGTGRLQGGSAEVDASESSQFVSGLLLAAPCFEEGLHLRAVGERLPSRPHLAMTVEAMRSAGARVEWDGERTWQVTPGSYAADDVDVEPDLSSASYFLAAAAATAGEVRLLHWPATTTQPGALLPALLERMGCRLDLDDDALVLRGPDRLDGLDADLSDCGELAPTVAVLATLAHSPSRLTGLAHLRGHETDRLAALARELGRLGARVEETPDGVVITPAPLHAAVLRTYEDHRLAMAFAVLGLVVPGVAVEDIGTTAKTVPDFAQRWAAMLAESA